MPLYLTIATINCCGLRDPAKRLAFFAYARKLDVQVLCLQETYSLPQDESKWQKEWGDKTQAVFNSNAEVAKKADAGTAVLLNNPLLKFGTIRKDNGGRILTAEIRCDCFGFQVVNVYAFTSTYPKPKREGFFNQIYDYLNLNSTVVFLGDFNCVENPTLDRCPSKNTTNTESKKLTEMIQLCKMFDCCEGQQQENRKHTYFSPNLSSRIDRIYATNDVKAISARVLPNQFSDHDTLIAQFNIPLPMVRGRGYWKNNVTCYQDENFLKDFETNWQNWKQTKSSLGLVDWWIEVKNKIKKLVIDHSTRLRQESFAAENDLKQQLDQLANLQYFKPNFKLHKETKKKLTKMQIDNFKKKLMRNNELFQYSHNFATKEFFRQFLQKREKVVISELIDEYGLPTTTPGEMVEHVRKYYAGLYGCGQTDLSQQNFFIDHISAKLSDQQNGNLQVNLSEHEIETAINQMAKGKAPGPDGLSIEFYIHCWSIIKHEVDMLRELFSTQLIKPQIKSGYLTLIHKKGPKNQITNYRPISLLNYDLKIFSKCLTNRLKPLITDLSQEHQYAKPGKQISSVTILLRDLWWDVCNSESDAYFISLDFQKAFDSVDQQWLFRVLQKMNFPTNFIQIIKSLNNNVHVKVLVNGFQTKNVQIQKGVRQGDPLSLYLFLLAVEPLVATINQNQNIEGLGKGRRRNIKCLSYADDLTLTLFGCYSVALAFETIQKFAKATGLKLNIEKTQGMAVGSSCDNTLLPSITWKNDSVNILGLKIGKLNSKIIWNDDLENLKRQKLSITVPFQTWQAKSLLAKAKLLPQITYTARTYPLDNRTQQIIETEFLNYLTNNSAIQLCMKNLQRPTIAGGIKYPNPTIYCDLFYISHLFEYFKARKYDLPFNANTYLIEYEIGLVLSKTYKLKQLNHLPHRYNLSPYYEQSIRILTKYKITLEELQTGKIKPIYKRLSLTDYNWSDHDKMRWKLTFNDILPNYLKTFNYRTVWNLLPFSHELGKCAFVQAGSGFGCPPFCQMQRYPTNLEITKRCNYKRYPKTIYN